MEKENKIVELENILARYNPEASTEIYDAIEDGPGGTYETILEVIVRKILKIKEEPPK